MGLFEVIEGMHLIPRWVPVAQGQTLYVGQLVKLGQANGVYGAYAMGAASGAVDATNKSIPFGVVTGTNNRTPVFDSTNKVDKITGVQTAANQFARYWMGVEGRWSKGDPQAMVKVMCVNPETVLKGRIFNSTIYTAPGVGTVTTMTSGAGFTCATSGFDFTAVAGNATYYCRKGINGGLQRVGTDTGAGTAAKTFDTYWPNFATGDQYVGLNIARGTVRAQFDSNSLFIDNSAPLTLNYYWLDVLDVDCTDAGMEYVNFRFNNSLFNSAR